jgi:hypothetical protein
LLSLLIASNQVRASVVRCGSSSGGGHLSGASMCLLTVADDSAWNLGFGERILAELAGNCFLSLNLGDRVEWTQIDLRDN